MSNSSISAKAKQQPKAFMTLRVFRAATGQWEDGPEVHAVEIGLSRFFVLKLKVLARLLGKFNAWLKKLEDMQ